MWRGNFGRYWPVLLVLLFSAFSGPVFGQDWSVPSSGVSRGEAIELLNTIEEQRILLSESARMLIEYEQRSLSLSAQLATLKAKLTNYETSVNNLLTSATDLQSLTIEQGNALAVTRTRLTVVTISLGVAVVVAVLGIIF